MLGAAWCPGEGYLRVRYVFEAGSSDLRLSLEALLSSQWLRCFETKCDAPPHSQSQSPHVPTQGAGSKDHPPEESGPYKQSIAGVMISEPAEALASHSPEALAEGILGLQENLHIV